MHPCATPSISDEIAVIILYNKVVDLVVVRFSVPLYGLDNERRSGKRDDGIANRQPACGNEAVALDIEWMCGMGSRRNSLWLRSVRTDAEVIRHQGSDS